MTQCTNCEYKCNSWIDRKFWQGFFSIERLQMFLVCVFCVFNFLKFYLNVYYIYDFRGTQINRANFSVTTIICKQRKRK